MREFCVSLYGGKVCVLRHRIMKVREVREKEGYGDLLSEGERRRRRRL